MVEIFPKRSYMVRISFCSKEDEIEPVALDMVTDESKNLMDIWFITMKWESCIKNLEDANIRADTRNTFIMTGEFLFLVIVGNLSVRE